MDKTKPLCAANGLGKIGKKFICKFFGHTVDQPPPQLRELATDLGLDLIGQFGALGHRLKPHDRTAFGKTGHTALALATEPPSMALLDQKPYSRQDNIVTPVMWRNIFGQALYQLAIFFCFLFC